MLQCSEVRTCIGPISGHDKVLIIEVSLFQRLICTLLAPQKLS